MLSVATVSSSSGAANYFAADNYYTRDENAGASSWGGQGAAALGLQGAVDKDVFEGILNGVQPGGQSVAPGEGRRAGVDLTFSMPKSASVMAYVAGDARILDAHARAVQATMRWVEKSFAEGRSYERNAKGDPVRTGNLVYAMFAHDTSRALDPQGHIHVIVANMTRMPDGSWKALHNGELWANNSLIGAAYHALLREGLEKLGYSTQVTGKHGSFEILGVPQDVLEAFSQRRAEILEKAGELAVTSAQGLREVTKRTRDPKLNVEDRDALRASWRGRADVLGFDGKEQVAKAIDRAGRTAGDARPAGVARLREVVADLGERFAGLFKPHDPLVDRGLERMRLSPADARTQAAVASAVRILEQREAAFPLAKVTHEALSLGLAGVTAPRIEQRLEQLIATQRLLPGQSGRADKLVTHVTTPGALASETKIIAAIDQGRGAAKPVLAADAAIAALQAAAGEWPLNAGQLAAATLALSSTDRIVAVQGVAGAGKSTMLAALARVAEGEGLKVQGLAFQNKVANALREETGIEAGTVSAFVNTFARHALAGKGDGFEAAQARLKGTVLVLDEASMVANDPMRHLLAITNALSVEKLILVGDRQQLQPIDAGKAFSLVQAADISLARMDENLRARTDQLRSVAALTNAGKARLALEALGSAVHESKGPGGDHVAAAAERWLALPAAERERTELFTSGRQARATLNTLVQAGLRAEGTLKGEIRTLDVLERVNLTREELRYAKSWEAGQVLEVVRGMRDLNLPIGRYDVTGVDARGRVGLRDRAGRQRKIAPEKIDPKDKRDALSLSVRETIKIQEGDRIKWTMNDKTRGLDNAALARVVGVTQDIITIETANRAMVELEAGDPMLERMGLAYALNMHMAQGMTADHAIGVMASSERNLSTQRLFNVMATRARDTLEIFTDDKARLATQLERNAGNKSSALETMGKIAIDASPMASAGGRGPRANFNPQLPPELAAQVRAGAKDERQHPSAAPQAQLQLPLPEKGLELGL